MKESLADQLSKKTGIPIPKNGKKKRQFIDVKEEHLSKGHIIYVPLSENEGLVVKDGYDERKKFIAIIGVTSDGTIIGSLLINTDPNEFTPQLGACQYPLKEKDYPTILDYDSWLDCSQIFRLSKKKLLLRGKHCGKVIDSDWGYIEPFLRKTDVLSNAEKKEFGII